MCQRIRVVVGVLAAMCCLWAATSAFAASGDLDATLGGDGIQTTAIGPGHDFAYGVAVQPDGKIITAGDSYDPVSSEVSVARYGANGTLDSTFSSDGKLTTPISGDAGARAVAIQSDDKIVVAGFSTDNVVVEFTIARYNPDGSLDGTFSGDGIQTTDVGGNGYVYAMAIQPDGKIVAAGYNYDGLVFELIVVRYNSDGSLDTSFSGDGIHGTPSGATLWYPGLGVALQADGKIVTAGYGHNGTNHEFAVVRHNSDGSLDGTFSGDGIQTTSVGAGESGAQSVVIQPDGKIVAAGFMFNGTDQDFALVRYGADGTLDSTFSGDGIQTTPVGTLDDFSFAVALQPDGRLVAIGSSDTASARDFATVRYNTDGTLDTTFSGDGKQTTDLAGADDYPLAMAIQPDGRIISSGASFNGTDFDYGIVRLAGDSVAPTNPVLASTSHTTSGWSNDRTIEVAVTGAADDNTGVAGFSYEWTTSATTTPDATQDAGASLAMLTSAALVDDDSHYLHLRTADVAGNWSAAVHVGPFKIDGTAPTSMVVSGATFAERFQSQRSFRVNWSAGSGVSGLSSYRVRYRSARYDGLFGSRVVWKSSTTGTSASFAGTPGRTYCFSARATDAAGNTTGYSTERCTAIPLDDRALSRSGTWFRGSGSGYYLSTYSLTSTPGAALLAQVSAKRISVIVTRCPGCGVVDVFFAGTKIARVNLNAASWDSRVFVSVASFTRVRSGKLVFRAASGKPGRVEGVGISRV